MSGEAAGEGPCGDCEIIGECRSDHPCAVKIQAALDELRATVAEAVALIDAGHLGVGAVHGCTLCDVYVLLTEGTLAGGADA